MKIIRPGYSKPALNQQPQLIFFQFEKKYLRNRIVAHIFATDWLLKQRFKKYEARHFSGNSRPDKAGNYYLNCIAGNDAERHC